MKFIKQSTLLEEDKRGIFKLWNNEYSERLGYKTLLEFENYLKSLVDQSHILLKTKDQNIQGWYVDFIRDNEKWFAIILDSRLQGQGFGTKILNLAKEKESVLNGWVIDHHMDKKKNGEPYVSPLEFYLKNGFKKVHRNRLELDNISAVKIKWEKKTMNRNGCK